MIPTISTRGFYDLSSGVKLNKKSYNLSLKKQFTHLENVNEFCVVIHGLRNDRASAREKFSLVQKRLKQLGYTYPIVGFTYDSNTRGAHLKKYEKHALCIGQKIAVKNGKNLAQFIINFKNHSPTVKIRLLGHSLGSLVISSTLENLSRMNVCGAVQRAYLFGSSLPADITQSVLYGDMIKNTTKCGILNYYSSNDSVLKYAHNTRQISRPLGLFGGKNENGFVHKKLDVENHRFISYISTLWSFP